MERELEHLGEGGWSAWEREVGVPERVGLEYLREGGWSTWEGDWST